MIKKTSWTNKQTQHSWRW